MEPLSVGSDTEEHIHISSDESLDIYCDKCSSFEDVIRLAVADWLDENAALLFSQMFIPKKVTSKKRKLNK